ncbi:2528_t:CDS:1 [Cetraspora pellucida]|uniref:2528_t:CDS:1 n=1 Tax=Cetraspora pellucida TaxID=1433469 RepID=A0A9N9K1U9_9GLOM|nr:2528_t:CDS:1 [Cetraspora pellucida]
MSFVKKILEKFNKPQNHKIIHKEYIDEQKKYIDDILQYNNIKDKTQQEYNNWENIIQDLASPNWTSEETYNENQSIYSINSNKKSESSLQLIEEKNQSTNSYQNSFINLNEPINLEITLVILLISLSFFSIIFVWIFGILLLWRMKFIIRKLKLADDDYITEINPFEIMFTQRQINNIFQMGNDIENTIENLVNGKTKIEDFLVIQVCIINDIFFSSDNQRLYTFQEAIRKGLNINKIPVKIRQITDLNIKWKLEGSYKIVRHNNFKNIIISPFAKNGRIIDKKGY